MKNKKLLIALGIVVVLAIVGIGIYMNHQQTADDNVIRIGAILPLSGELAEEGQKALYAIRMAEQHVNSDAEKTPVRIFIEDGKFTGKDSAAAFQKLAMQGIDAVISFGTPCTGAIRDSVRKAQIPMMALDGTAVKDKDNPWSFICIHSVRQVGVAMSRYVGKVAGNGRVAVLFMKDSSGDEFCEGFQSVWSGAEPIIESYAHDSVETKSIVTKVLSDTPSAVCVFGYGIGYVSVLNGLLDAGGKIPLITDMNITSALGKLRNGGKGIQFISLNFGMASPNEASHRFITEMKSLCGLTPTVFSAFAHEAVNMLAVERNIKRPYPPALKEHLERLRNFPSVIGELSYDANRELLVSFNIYQLSEDGAEVFVAPVD